ncbi:flocculation protein FLO11-like [Sphaeramia orbicularis]|uniref:flocculation protein FLO11-like n=1 Tax=Sphaeramia orbicularis TaxID=375764 RepID=UPI00117C77F1|nr:flocculation protein FLO11-like [Sphaeramia orbicularis]
MSVQTSRKSTTTTYRTMNTASAEPGSTTTYRTVKVASSPDPVPATYRTLRVVSPDPVPKTATYRTVSVASPDPVANAVISAAPVSPMPYAVNGSYEGFRYLVPVQTAVQQPSYVMMQQPVMQQMVSPVYLHSMAPQLSVSSHDSDLMYRRQSTAESISGKSSSVFSQSSSPIKSPELSVEEEVRTHSHTLNYHLNLLLE